MSNKVVRILIHATIILMLQTDNYTSNLSCSYFIILNFIEPGV